VGGGLLVAISHHAIDLDISKGITMGDFELQVITIKNPINVEVDKLVLVQGVKHDNKVHNQIEYFTRGVDGN
jgi:hypothetical protein